MHATELGIVVADEREIKGSLVGYDRDPDIMAIVVTDMTGKVLATHGSPPESTAQLVRRQRQIAAQDRRATTCHGPRRPSKAGRSGASRWWSRRRG